MDSLEETRDREPHTHLVQLSRKDEVLPDSKQLDAFAQERGRLCARNGGVWIHGGRWLPGLRVTQV